MSDRLYYEVLPDSPVMEIVDEFFDQRQRIADAIEQFRKAHGAAHIWSTTVFGGSRLSGLEFPDGLVPRGWRWNGSYCVPDRKSKIGKDLDKVIRGIQTRMDWLEFSRRLSLKLNGEGYTNWEDHRLQWSTAGKYQGRVILSVPMVLKPSPPGCVEMLPSVVRDMIESAQAERKEAA